MEMNTSSIRNNFVYRQIKLTEANVVENRKNKIYE